MRDADVAEWLSNCTHRDVPALLEKVERSYRHPYGFTVCRLTLRHLAPWNVRLHFWPSPLECYERLRDNRTAHQLIHAHGWDLLSVVMNGELEERTYEPRADQDGDFTLYTTRPEASSGVSILRATGQKLAIGAADKKVRASHHGAHSILSGTYHSTLPAARSTSLVAAKQSPGQASEVAVYRGVAEQIANAAPQQPVDELPELSAAGPPDNWSSFAFFVRAGHILLVRTVAHPQLWHPVGGRRDTGDSSPIDTLVREAREEIGVTLDPAMTAWLGSREADLGTGTVCFWMIADHALADPLPLPRDEIAEARWWSFAEARILPMYQASAETLRQLTGAG